MSMDHIQAPQKVKKLRYIILLNQSLDPTCLLTIEVYQFQHSINLVDLFLAVHWHLGMFAHP